MFLSLSPVYEQVMMCETLMFVHVIYYALVIIVFKGGSNCQSKSMNMPKLSMDCKIDRYGLTRNCWSDC